MQQYLNNFGWNDGWRIGQNQWLRKAWTKHSRIVKRYIDIWVAQTRFNPWEPLTIRLTSRSRICAPGQSRQCGSFSDGQIVVDCKRRSRLLSRPRLRRLRSLATRQEPVKTELRSTQARVPFSRCCRVFLFVNSASGWGKIYMHIHPAGRLRSWFDMRWYGELVELVPNLYIALILNSWAKPIWDHILSDDSVVVQLRRDLDSERELKRYSWVIYEHPIRSPAVLSILEVPVLTTFYFHGVNVAWPTQVLHGEGKPVLAGSCVHFEGNVLVGILAWHALVLDVVQSNVAQLPVATR